MASRQKQEGGSCILGNRNSITQNHRSLEQLDTLENSGVARVQIKGWRVTEEKE